MPVYDEGPHPRRRGKSCLPDDVLNRWNNLYIFLVLSGRQRVYLCLLLPSLTLRLTTGPLPSWPSGRVRGLYECGHRRKGRTHYVHPPFAPLTTGLGEVINPWSTVLEDTSTQTSTRKTDLGPDGPLTSSRRCKTPGTNSGPRRPDSRSTGGEGVLVTPILSWTECPTTTGPITDDDDGDTQHTNR